MQDKNPYEILYYHKHNEEIPVEEFIQKLSVKSRQKFYTMICVFLEKWGPKIPMPHAKPIGDGLYELRVQQGSDRFRVVYFFYERYAVLTNAFRKKTNKIPTKELDLAKKRRKDFMEGIKEGRYEL